MKRLLVVTAAALALTACATATPYQPAASPHGQGYTEMRIEPARWRVSFQGNSVTDRETVETYLLYRAAELTLANGGTWFALVNRDTERQSRLVATPSPFSARYGPYWSPYWRAYRGGFWRPYDPFWDRDIDVRQIDRYEASAEILIGQGPKPVNDPAAFDAREVVENLRPRIQYPTR